MSILDTRDHSSRLQPRLHFTMPTLAAQSALDANLAALAGVSGGGGGSASGGERNAAIAAALRQSAPTDDLVFLDTDEPAPSALYRGSALASRRRPLDEAHRLIEPVDLVEHAVIVIHGFGLGHHVQALAERLGRKGIIIVLEPDVGLLRAVFERIDHSRWLGSANVIIVTDPADSAGLSRALEGCESVLSLGVAFIDHPASRARLAGGDAALVFSRTFRDHMDAARTTMMTSLVRAADTVRNFILNIDHYAGGAGVAELANIAAGCPAVVVSAGPSLHRNLHVLANPRFRGRCVIIATQTTLKPLLAAGIAPHFVTALDYAEISKRFYEGLDPAALRGITLVAEAKAHPVIIDAFLAAGAAGMRCCQAEVLDAILGDLKGDMGRLPMGATVAHLAVYLARHLGCGPIITIGQDLGFPDGLYYAPGTAIERVWAPELNPFNTMEMMQWQRIVRHRLHLRKVEGADGRPIYTDRQMAAYLDQFERDFARFREEGLEVIDATEGGAAKRHATAMPLAEALALHARTDVPAIPPPPREPDPKRLDAVRSRVRDVRQSIVQLRAIARTTIPLIQRMLDDQCDSAAMQRHFREMDRLKARVEQRMDALALVGHLNQLGQFKRLRADRRLDMQRDLDPMQRQRAELQRDLVNVQWIDDAATELIDLLADAGRLLAGEAIDIGARPARNAAASCDVDDAMRHRALRIAALIAIDPETVDLDAKINGRPVLRATIERLGASRALDSIIVIVQRGIEARVRAMIDGLDPGVPLHIECCDGSPFRPEHAAIRAARRFSPMCWRGGIAGLSMCDEVLCPRAMHEVMARRGLDAAVIVGPDWPLVQVTDDGGIDALLARHRTCPDKLDLVFTQSPPGLGACLISTKLMGQLADRNRLSTIGSLLVYQPHAPQHDPIARDACVQIDHRVRDSLVRLTAGSPREIARIEAVAMRSDAASIISAVRAFDDEHIALLPHHVIIELTPRRASCGIYRRSLLGNGRFGAPDRPDLSLDAARRLFDQLEGTTDLAITFAGLGDPLLHPQFDDIIQMCHAAPGAMGRPVALDGSARAERPTMPGAMGRPVALDGSARAERPTMPGAMGRPLALDGSARAEHPTMPRQVDAADRRNPHGQAPKTPPAHGTRQDTVSRDGVTSIAQGHPHGRHGRGTSSRTAIHLRTELLADRAALDRLLAAHPDVVSIDLHADRAATYEAMMGCDRFREVLLNLEHIINRRIRLTPHEGLAAIATPWIVPRLQRRAETIDDLESFFDRWMLSLGCAVIEPPPPFDPTPHHPADKLLPAGRSPHVAWRELTSRMVILSDGSVPISEMDIRGENIVGTINDRPLSDLWHDLIAARRKLRADMSGGGGGIDAEALRTFLP